MVKTVHRGWMRSGDSHRDDVSRSLPSCLPFGMDAQRRLASRRCLQKPALLPSIRVQCITQRIIPPKNLIQKYRKGYASKYVRRLCVIYISCMKINVPLSYFVIDFWLYGQPSSTVEERSLILVKIWPNFCLKNWLCSKLVSRSVDTRAHL